MPKSEKDLVLVLRFRDLAPPIPGNTISEHEKIIAAHGYTWWGWWKKQKETIPVALWGEVLKQARRPEGVIAFLLDSGQRYLYQTTIHTIFSDPGELFVHAPEDGTRTPRYYYDRQAPEKFASWFKLGEIQRVDDNTLSKYVYEQRPHDDLVAVDTADLLGRRVSGPGELLFFGNITYWVLTPVGPDAKPSRQTPLTTNLVEPIAPKEIIAAESNTILHITDIHAAKGKHAFPLYNQPHDTNARTLAEAIYDSLLRLKILPGIVIVTGDLTWMGSEAEFENAFQILDALRSTTGLTRQHFVIVPGNHDIQWTPEQRDGVDYKWDGAVTIASDEARRNYEQFFLRWYDTAPNEFLSIGRRYFLAGGPAVDVIGLNSMALQQVENHFAGLGRVTETAFDKTVARMGWNNDRRDTKVRILAMHHHLMPVVMKESPQDAKKGFGGALDAGSQIMRALEHKVDLLVHGHQHHPFAGFVDRPDLLSADASDGSGLLVLGGGSCGVADEHLGPIKQRCFNLLTVDHDAISSSLFTSSEATDEFRAASRIEARYGGSWKRCTKE